MAAIQMTTATAMTTQTKTRSRVFMGLPSGDLSWMARHEPDGDENQYANDYDQHGSPTPHVSAASADQGWTAMEIASSTIAAATTSAIAKLT